MNSSEKILFFGALIPYQTCELQDIL